MWVEQETTHLTLEDSIKCYHFSKKSRRVKRYHTEFRRLKLDSLLYCSILFLVVETKTWHLENEFFIWLDTSKVLYVVHRCIGNAISYGIGLQKCGLPVPGKQRQKMPLMMTCQVLQEGNLQRLRHLTQRCLFNYSFTEMSCKCAFDPHSSSWDATIEVMIDLKED